MPDYEFRLWNEDNSPMVHSFVRSAYSAGKYAFVADYVRFWALYNFGGIYLDTDMYVIRDFSPLLETNFFGGWETPMATPAELRNDADCNISCGVLGARAFGVEIKEILDEYDKLLFSEDDRDKLVVPRIITPILMKHKESITIYPYDYFYPLPFYNRFEKDKMHYNTLNTYAVHLWNLSWVPLWEQYLSRLIRRVKKIFNK